jgi:20S proteasome alpha/beta subunit
MLNVTDPKRLGIASTSGYVRDKDKRRPTPAELGLDVTVGIVALSHSDNCFVLATDQMLSYGDFFQATDQGTKKTLQVADHWYLNFAGSTSNAVDVYKRARSKIRSIGDDNRLTTSQVRGAITDAYSDVLRDHFVSTELHPVGYKSVDDFRKDGLSELGSNIFSDYLTKLSNFDIDVELTVFGFNENGKPRYFEVHSPGRAMNVAVLGYSVVGSGYSMAIASLRRKPIIMKTNEIIYRVLEAKFSAETASGVGRSTTLEVIDRNEARSMPDNQINEIRAIWEGTQKQPSPSEALALIDQGCLIPNARI